MIKATVIDVIAKDHAFFIEIMPDTNGRMLISLDDLSIL